MAVSELHPSATITSEADVTEQPEQPQQPHMMDLILVTYNASSAFADLFRDAKNNAYGIVCHDYLGARDRPCYVGVSCACCYMFCRGVAGLSFQARL